MRKAKPLPAAVLPKRLCKVCGAKLFNANFAGLGWTCMADGCDGGPRQDPNEAVAEPKRRRKAT
jgi:hypothetical protein